MKITISKLKGLNLLYIFYNISLKKFSVDISCQAASNIQNISSRLSRDEDVWALGPINHQTSFERRDETRWFATKHWDWGQMFLLDLKLDVPDVAWMANTNSLFFLKHSQIFVYSKLNLISRIFLETKLCIDERVVNAIIKRNQNLGQFLFAQLLI